MRIENMKLNQKDQLLIVSSLRDAGVRVTKQRVALLYILDNAKDHPDAIELYKRASEVEPTISLATVATPECTLISSHISSIFFLLSLGIYSKSLFIVLYFEINLISDLFTETLICKVQKQSTVCKFLK